jgi:hypothetical protein
MAYRLPTFNLNATITRAGGFSFTFSCNLAWGQRVNTGYGERGSPGIYTVFMTLLCPALTDIRGSLSTTGADQVEVPSGSGRIYQAVAVDDIGKGFPNEHRAALLEQRIQPTPLT